MEKPKETNIRAEDIKIDVLYEDEDIIAINKPKGMVVHPANRQSRRNARKCTYEYLPRNAFWNWRSH